MRKRFALRSALFFVNFKEVIEQYFGVIEGFLAAYGLAAVFLLGFAEEIFFFLPTSLLFIGVGFFMIDVQLKFGPALLAAVWKIGFPATLGITLGALLIYWIIYWGGRSLIRKVGKYVNMSWENIEDLHNKFRRGYVDEAALTFLRAVPILPIGVISIFCGLIRLELGEFIFTTIIGTMIRITSLSMLGWYLGKEYIKYAEQVAAIERYFVLFLMLLAIGGLIYVYVRQRKQEK